MKSRRGASRRCTPEHSLCGIALQKEKLLSEKKMPILLVNLSLNIIALALQGLFNLALCVLNTVHFFWSYKVNLIFNGVSEKNFF
jgi:hypothetical protein